MPGLRFELSSSCRRSDRTNQPFGVGVYRGHSRDVRLRRRFHLANPGHRRRK